jgi:hypothetical protein
LAVPAQKGLRGHDETAAAPFREHSSERRKESTIGRPEPGSTRLPSKHDELIPQHEQLDVFGELAPSAPNEQPQHSREREISEGKKHPAMLPEPGQRFLREHEPRF